MEPTTAYDELVWIRSMMADSQDFLADNWTHQLVWGLVGTIGLSITWLALRAGSYLWIPVTWAVLVLVGWLYSLVIARRAETRAAVRNVAVRACGGIWLGLGVTLTILGSLTLFTSAIEPRSVPGLIAVVFGAGYFGTGFLVDVRWLRGVGIAWWAGGVGLFLWGSLDAILALAGMTMLLAIVPALLLRGMNRTQREHTP